MLCLCFSVDFAYPAKPSTPTFSELPAHVRACLTRHDADGACLRDLQSGSRPWMSRACFVLAQQQQVQQLQYRLFVPAHSLHRCLAVLCVVSPLAFSLYSSSLSFSLSSTAQFQHLLNGWSPAQPWPALRYTPPPLTFLQLLELLLTLPEYLLVFSL